MLSLSNSRLIAATNRTAAVVHPAMMLSLSLCHSAMKFSTVTSSGNPYTEIISLTVALVPFGWVDEEYLSRLSQDPAREVTVCCWWGGILAPSIGQLPALTPQLKWHPCFRTNDLKESEILNHTVEDWTIHRLTSRLRKQQAAFENKLLFFLQDNRERPFYLSRIDVRVLNNLRHFHRCLNMSVPRSYYRKLCHWCKLCCWTRESNMPVVILHRESQCNSFINI